MTLYRAFKNGFRRGWDLFWSPFSFLFETRKPWRLSYGNGYRRAFIQSPRNPVTMAYIWLRGWRRKHWTWWSKGNAKQQNFDQNYKG